jgi:2'-hydroxyisoflavone reductase
MKLLIIGGTRFVGRALVEVALARGHEVTLFHRGQSNPDIFPDVERILGNRDGELEKLGNRQWDAVIDTCGYVPRIVKASAEYLADKVKTYVFISTISVFKESNIVGRDEDAELATMEDETIEEVTGESYGALKVLCEKAAEAAMPGRVVQIRPGLIVGPHDPTNRFTYWPVRVRKGGDVLVPDGGSGFAQFIDVRDLADFTIKCLEDGTIGTFNATGPEKPTTIQHVLDVSKQVTGSNANFVSAPSEWLLEKEVGPWMELPLWLPTLDDQALMQISIDRAVAKGMKFRSLEDTVRDTLAWYDEIKGDEKQWNAGMKPEKEAELLEELKAKAN